ncbi:hypothetical protein MMC07_008165 [Pseudocyphellaria aurata]|nr:hypothetical protein [Pseudocyphellaria aurata]
MPWGRRPMRNHIPWGEYIPKGNKSIAQEGAFNAGVFIVKRLRDGRLCAEKRIKRQEIMNGAAKYEISVLRELNHEHITEYIDSFIDKSGRTPRASIYMEYCDLGSLASFLKNFRRPPAEWAVWEMFIQLTNAVAYCHYGVHNAVLRPDEPRDAAWVTVLHRDIKPGNVFLRSGHSCPKVVLGDFGQSVMEQDDGHWEKRQHMGYDEDWAPPEAPYYDRYSDMWSIGLVVQAMCRLETSPPTIGPKRTYWGAGRDFSELLSQVIRQLMRTDPQDRPFMASFAPKLDVWRHRVPHGDGLPPTGRKRAS